MSTTMLVERAQHEPEDSNLAGWIVTFVPLALIGILFVVALRVARQTRRRSDEAIALYKEMLAELRGIRAELEKKP